MRSAEIQIVALGEFDPVIKQTIFTLEISFGRKPYKQDPPVNWACADLSTGSTDPF